MKVISNKVYMHVRLCVVCTVVYVTYICLHVHTCMYDLCRPTQHMSIYVDM